MAYFPQSGASRLVQVRAVNGNFPYYGALEIYDPLTNAWTSAAALPMVRGGLAVGVISGSMYAIGGRNAATPALANNERLTP